MCWCQQSGPEEGAGRAITAKRERSEQDQGDIAVQQMDLAASTLRRKRLRMQGWDFTSPGWYFITICTKKMHAAFGTVVNGRMVLNAAGHVADRFWREIPGAFPARRRGRTCRDAQPCARLCTRR